MFQPPALPPLESRYHPETFQDKFDAKPRSKRVYLQPTTPRFAPDRDKVPTPGPGFYGKDHIPDRRLQLYYARANGKVSPGTYIFNSLVGMLKERYKGGSQGPGTYNLKDPIMETLKKVVSLKGPYNLFTAPERDWTSYVGHQRALPKAPPSPASYVSVDDLVKRLNNTANKYKGKMPVRGHCLVWKMYSDPGLYHIKEPKGVVPAFNVPFGSTLSPGERVELGQMNGPGRYNPKFFYDDPEKNTYHSSFKSRTKIPQHLLDFYATIWKERNVPPTDRHNYEPPLTGKEHLAIWRNMGRKAIHGMD